MRVVSIVGAVVLAGLVIVVVRRRGGSLATGRVIVRCRNGHLFATTWIPFVSFTAVRLGSRRFQRCPVGRHWTIVVPVRDEDLTDEQRRDAAAHGDRGWP